jgi:hypothetical protein
VKIDGDVVWSIATELLAGREGVQDWKKKTFVEWRASLRIASVSRRLGIVYIYCIFNLYNTIHRLCTYALTESHLER